MIRYPPIAITTDQQARALLGKLQAAPPSAQPQLVTIGPVAINIPALNLLGGGMTAKWADKFRYLGPITALMTISERGNDRLTITQHPVAMGAMITDHSFMEPATLDLTMMATNSVSGAWSNDYVQNVYQQLLALQQSRATFPIQTGKRLYQHMLMQSIGVVTDQHTESALMVNISCQEIIKVYTSTTPVAQPANMADPAKTAPVPPAGTKQPAPSTYAVPVWLRP